MAIRDTSKRAAELSKKVKKPKTIKNKSSSKKGSTKSNKNKSSKKSTIKGKAKNNYFAESYRELKRVTWPSRKETWRLTIAVFLFSGVFTGVIMLADFIFRNIIERVIL